MGRTRVVRDLPTLGEILGGSRGFAHGECREARIQSLLIPAIRQLRRANRRPFYPLREVAAFFRVSLRTVERVYRQLETQGLIFCARGSMTVIRPRASVPRIPVRAVVGLLVWYPGFILFPEWQQFFLGLEAELRRQRFATDLIFFGQGEELHPRFAKRVVDRNPDYVFWFCPDPGDRPVLAAFRDAGMPAIVLTTLPGIIPGRYHLSLAAAYRAGLEAWLQDGIRRVTMWRVSRAPAEGGVQEAWGQRPGVTLEPATTQADLFSTVRVPSTTGVVFEDDMALHRLCGSRPHDMLGLVRRTRVMIAKAIRLWASDRRDDRVDLIFVPWLQIARQIGRDFGRETMIAGGPPIRFEAEWRPRVPLRQLGELFDRVATEPLL
jgi:hypothetical protein